MSHDPLLDNEVQPTLTVAAMVRADERLGKEFPKITLPVLILHGTLDKAAKPSGSQAFYDATGSKDKTLKAIRGLLPRSIARRRQGSRHGGHPGLAGHAHRRGLSGFTPAIRTRSSRVARGR
jgi:hypothetical protein